MLQRTVLAAAVAFTLMAWPGTVGATDHVLGADFGERVALTIDERSGNPAAHTVRFSARDSSVAPAAPASGGDPRLGGATAAVFSGAACRCIRMAPAPDIAPGWSAKGQGAPPDRYAWRDAASGSTADLRRGHLSFKSKGTTFGLGTTPQGEIEVQLRIGSGADVSCTRFAAPDQPASDSPVKYRATHFDVGTTSCSPLPASCAACAASSDSIELVETRIVGPYQVDYYRNLAMPCSIGGHQTFALAHRTTTPASAVRPLWVFLHGGGFGFFDASGNPVPDSQYMTEETLDDLLYSSSGGLASAGLISLIENDAADFRLLGVSMCSRDFYNGVGNADPNNPHLQNDGSPTTTNGLLATTAAIAFAQSTFPTSKYFLHGGSAGAVGAYGLAWRLELAGNPPAGAIPDSGVLNQSWILAAIAQGVPCPLPGATSVLTSPAKVAALGARLDPEIADPANDPDLLVSSGRLTVPLANVWVRGDPYYCGAHTMQCPLRDGSSVTLGSADCMYEPLRRAVVAQGSGSRSVNLPLCVDAGCTRHMPTRFNVNSTDPQSPADFNAALLGWVHARLAD